MLSLMRVLNRFRRVIGKTLVHESVLPTCLRYVNTGRYMLSSSLSRC